ncbi:MAG: transcription factor S [uncultured DHVE6 group euryarchaeote]|jgi:DNA-directed RNA polymerase subunit M|nr:MAG: transcription factor S [uncultured DHVE6 group euryarchaeote]
MVAELFNKDGSIKIPTKSVKLKEKTHREEKGKGASTNQESTMATVTAECEKCNHTEAYWWTEQTRSSDEPETQFFRCTKCKHTWREYT